MPHAQRHRGAHPDDPRLFAPTQLSKLREATEEAGWLLGRGYAPDSLVDLVCRRHQLESRQKNAVTRSMCAPDSVEQRARKCTPDHSLQDQELHIDGFNTIITLEVAVSGGALFRGKDRALRDIAGLRGSYHPVEETEQALQLLGEALQSLRIRNATFYLDAPISNSGRLRARILDHAPSWGFPVDAQVVPDPDRSLVGLKGVVSSDSVVLDRAASWVNLVSAIVGHRLPNAWIIDLGEDSAMPEPEPALGSGA